MTEIQDSIEEWIEKFRRKIESNPEFKENVSTITKTVNIDLGEESYSFKLENAEIPELAVGMYPEADITLRTTPQHMKDLMNGDLRPMKAYIKGYVKIEGKIQDIMFLKKFL